MSLFTAKYPGWCARCGQHFNVGDNVRYDVDGLCGEACCDVGDEYVTDEVGKKPSGVCPRCFTVHVGECL